MLLSPAYLSTIYNEALILDWDPELESHIEGNLATEVAMIVLDTLAVVEQVVFH